MCGICCVLCIFGDDVSNTKCLNAENSRLHQRGPDCSSDCSVQLQHQASLSFHGHVLHLRGDHIISQPTQDTQGNVLLWNGEIFNGIKVGDDESDTKVLLSCLARDPSEEHVTSVMSTIQGPWAFIYWQASSESLWFGRDVFGRRSLLWHLPESHTDQFLLSSVRVKPFGFTEIPSVGIYRLRLKKPSHVGPSAHAYEISLFPWKHAVWPRSLDPVCRETFQSKITEGMKADVPAFQLCEDRQVQSQMPGLNKQVPDDPGASSLPPLDDGTTHLDYLKKLLSTNTYLQTLSRQLTQVLLEAVRTRVFNQQRRRQDDGDVCKTSSEATNCCSRTQTNHATNDADTNGDISRCSLTSDVDGEVSGYILNKELDGTAPVSGVVNDISEEMAACSISSDPLVSPAHVAILFSGGIDSTVLAALADRCVPKDEPIDLMNVAFEQREKNAGQKKRPKDKPACRGWDVPDRLTGHIALSELNPDRQWNFIEVNVTAAELQEARASHISDLLYPLETVLDDSIGCAVWFAARGQGILGNGTRKSQKIHSRAKVILCGMGADEQLAGYSRHRGRFKSDGWPGLMTEIELELTRLSARNLGRDDRIITDHGKESRFPFLDERVVKFLCSLPIQDKADLTLPRGLGEKLLLRLCAVELGLPQTATLPKRAIQFGSRIAKLENSKENASDKCERLVNTKS